MELARSHISDARRLLVSCLRSYRGAEHPVMVAIAVEGLAMMAQDDARAQDGAELWGFADGIRAACGMPLSPARQIERDRYLDNARTRLGVDAVDRALAAGRLLSHEDVLSRVGSRRGVELPAFGRQVVPKDCPSAGAHHAGSNCG